MALVAQPGSHRAARGVVFDRVGATLRAHDRSVDVYVHKLRSKLTRAVPECRFIHTHFGFGYRFEPEPSPHQRNGNR